MGSLCAWLTLSLFVVSGAQATRGPSPTCRQVEGQKPADYQRALAFCRTAIPAALEVEGIKAMDTLVWVKISRDLADVLMRDKLTTEQIVKNWMKAWRGLVSSQVVTVTVQWQDVDIAVGDTSIFSGDKVTIK